MKVQLEIIIILQNVAIYKILFKKNMGMSINYDAKVPFGIEAPQDHRKRNIKSTSGTCI